jgi:hypothetical protein
MPAGHGPRAQYEDAKGSHAAGDNPPGANAPQSPRTCPASAPSNLQSPLECAATTGSTTQPQQAAAAAAGAHTTAPAAPGAQPRRPAHAGDGESLNQRCHSSYGSTLALAQAPFPAPHPQSMGRQQHLPPAASPAAQQASGGLVGAALAASKREMRVALLGGGSTQPHQPSPGHLGAACYPRGASAAQLYGTGVLDALEEFRASLLAAEAAVAARSVADAVTTLGAGSGAAVLEAAVARLLAAGAALAALSERPGLASEAQVALPADRRDTVQGAEDVGVGQKAATE